MSEPRSFYETLREIRGGAIPIEMAAALQQLVAAVTSTGKAGKVTLTFSVQPFQRAEGALVVKDKIDVTLPKIESDGTVMWATPDNNMQRDHPKQDDLPGIRLASEGGR